MKYKHIIWDWNGTIVNDSWLSLEVLNSILRDFKLKEISLDFYRQNFSFPVVNFYRQIGFDVSKEAFEEIGEVFITRFNDKRYDCKLQVGVLELIKKLNDLNIEQSLLSAYKKDFLLQACEFFGVKKYMNQIEGLSDIYANTKLALGLEHIKNIKVARDSILYIGDTTHDFEVADAMGVECRLISLGHQNRKKLQETGAKVYDDFFELKKEIFDE